VVWLLFFPSQTLAELETHDFAAAISARATHHFLIIPFAF
jgi:hypothetical protein